MNADFLRSTWRVRSFIGASIRREFQTRWGRTQLGPAWIVLQPLATIVIFTVIFSELMRPVMPEHASRYAYSIYLCSGILAWNFFAESLGRTVSVFVDYSYMLKKIAVPKIALPMIVFGSSLIHFLVGIALFVVFLAAIGELPGASILALVPLVFIQLALTAGLGVLLATANVFYRDIQHSVAVLLQFWFWLTPIVYLPGVLPDGVRSALEWNPLLPLVQGYQVVFLRGTAPDWSALFYPASLAALLIAAAVLSFYRLRGEIVDEL